MSSAEPPRPRAPLTRRGCEEGALRAPRRPWEEGGQTALVGGSCLLRFLPLSPLPFPSETDVLPPRGQRGGPDAWNIVRTNTKQPELPGIPTRTDVGEPLMSGTARRLQEGPAGRPRTLSDSLHFLPLSKS
ncbi:hypothetical protein E2C01_029941 [Portunus trituberculatus]|uniref:Uncharacterized protein n=1 Tax=Portunus trituberculatus TaxID=210409 RepID=A0A5B7EQP9_PORTR|nr:hypothetical protein [Portunus trituberculatus]